MSKAHYTRAAITLHWVGAGLILAGLVVGWTMTEMPISPQRLKVYNYHKWLGVTVLALALLRLVVRIARPPPAPPPMAPWQRLAARGGHWMLYVLMLVVPLAGWVYSNAAGYPVVYLGKLPLPNLVGPDKGLAALWVEIHGSLAAALAVVAGLHVLAALQHHFIARDNTMRRMLTWRR